jgi:hypothetical protein
LIRVGQPPTRSESIKEQLTTMWLVRCTIGSCIAAVSLSVAAAGAKAKSAGAIVLVDPYVSDERRSAMVAFPGGNIAEIHSAAQ